MAGIRRFKLIIGIFIPFFLISLMSHNTFAAQFNSWINIQDISKTNLSNDWITHNTSNAGSYFVSGSTRLQTYQLSASASLSSALSGSYFNASGSIYIEVPNDLDGGVVCSAFTNGAIVPENVSINVTSTSVTNCSYESAPYVNKYTININTLGSISSGSPTSFYFYLVSDPNEPFISLVGTPDNSPRVFISGDINFSSSSSPELNSLTEINQNIVVISGELQNMQQQMSQNTESIINNQNENTEAIIKSNQNCYPSKNLFDISKVMTVQYLNSALINNNNGSLTVTTSSTSSSVAAGPPRLLKNYCPTCVAGETYSLSFNTTGSDNYIYIYGTGANLIWHNNTSKIITQAMLDSQVLWYASGLSTSATISNIQIEKGSSPTEYVPFGDEYCVDIDQEYYDEQRQADQNISNQSTSDIQGAENQKTTDLIGALGSLVGALTTIHPDDDCSIQLDFPSYAGGTRTINPCQNKEKAPQIVLIGSSVYLVIFALKYWNVMAIKIYKVIRSFIDGTDDTEGEE